MKIVLLIPLADSSKLLEVFYGIVGLVEVIVQLERIKLKLHECSKSVHHAGDQVHAFYHHKLQCYVSHPSW